MRRYGDDLHRSAELLRLALAEMDRRDVSPDPVSFAVWYEYVSGANDALRREVDMLTAGGARLGADATRRLFDTHVAGSDGSHSSELDGRIDRMLSGVGAPSAQAGGAPQSEAGGQASAPPRSALLDHVDSVLRETLGLQEAMDSLTARLAAARGEVELLRAELSRVRADTMVEAPTGLANPRAFGERLDALVSDPMGGSLVLLDVDDFQLLCETYGQPFGDRLLRALGAVFKDAVRGSDTVARYGEEGFSVLLPATGLPGAMRVAENLRERVSRARIRRINSDQTVGSITASCGVAACAPGEDAQVFLARAERALRIAKDGGSNRVTAG